MNILTVLENKIYVHNYNDSVFTYSIVLSHTGILTKELADSKT